MMNDIILEEIKKNKLAANIAYDLHIHDLDLYKKVNELQNIGYSFKRKFYSDGTFAYINGNDNSTNNSKYIDILTDKSEERISILCLSDTHISSTGENADLIKRAFDYGYNKGIRLVFLGGDILNGNFGWCGKTIDDGITQVERFLEVYPHSNDVLTIGVGGNHELSILEDEYIDPIKMITSRRHDIVIPGYRVTEIRINNANMALCHPTTKIHVNEPVEVLEDDRIKIEGHHHKYGFYVNNKTTTVALPATSNLDQGLGGFVELTLKFSKNLLIKEIKAEYITYINGRFVTLATSTNNITQKSYTTGHYKKGFHLIFENNYPLLPEVNNSEEVERLKSLNEQNVNSIKSLENENTELKEKLEQENLNKINAQNKNEDLKDENRRLTNTVKTHAQAINRLTGEVSTTQKENEELKSSLGILKEKEEVLSSQLTREFNTNESLKSSISKMKKDISNKDNKITKLETKNTDLEKNNKKITESYNSLKNSHEEILRELNEYKALLEQYKNGKLVSEVNSTDVVEEVKKAVLIAETEELTPEKMYSIKKEQIEKYKEFLKKEPKEETIDNRREEFLQIVEEFNEEEKQTDPFEDEEFVERMCDVMDNVSMQLSGEEEKKRIIKDKKAYNKGKRIDNSQLTRDEQIEKLKRKYNYKNR